MQNASIKVIEVTDCTIFPPHYETDTAFSHSTHITENGIQLAATLNIVHASGKLLYLYYHTLRENLQWTQDTVQVWGEAVIENNPSPPIKPTEV